MPRVLVATPARPDEHHFFRACMAKYAIALPQMNPGFRFTFATTEDDFSEGRTRLGAIAAARNAILDEHLDGHDYVLIMDSDVVSLPFDIVTQLQAANPDGITAPAVLIEGSERFYDTDGFIETGMRARPDWPYFTSQDALVEMDSVGTMYLAPGKLFETVRYADEPAGRTDHEEVCAGAREMGMRVLCARDVLAYHAGLPLYDLRWR